MNWFESLFSSSERLLASAECLFVSSKRGVRTEAPSCEELVKVQRKTKSRFSYETPPIIKIYNKMMIRTN